MITLCILLISEPKYNSIIPSSQLGNFCHMIICWPLKIRISIFVNKFKKERTGYVPNPIWFLHRRTSLSNSIANSLNSNSCFVVNLCCDRSWTLLKTMKFHFHQLMKGVSLLICVQALWPIMNSTVEQWLNIIITSITFHFLQKVGNNCKAVRQAKIARHLITWIRSVIPFWKTVSQWMSFL